MVINTELMDSLLAQAASTPRLRMNYDLRTTPEDGSQRILNALLPGTPMPIHRHNATTEVVAILRGKMEEIFYDAVEVPASPDGSQASTIGKETGRVLLEAGGDISGISIPAGQWHGINVIEPTVLLECKDGPYSPLAPEDILNI